MIYPLYLVANLSMLVLAWILAPILPLFALGKDHLPAWLSWFDTPDNPLYGDSGFIEANGPDSYWNRVLWLWRNPAYGFDYTVISCTVTEEPTFKGDPLTSNIPGHSGWWFLTMNGYWEFMWVRQWGSSPTCIRVRLGWKLHGVPVGGKAQFVFSPRPWVKFGE
jgi:hypothetical protein